MIGGMMLLCAVGAMVLIAHWSLERDNLQGAAAATGLLALRKSSTQELARATARKKGKPSGKRARGAQTRTRRGQAVQRQAGAAPDAAAAQTTEKPTRPTRFDIREMMDVAGELEEKGNGLPVREDRVGF